MWPLNGCLSVMVSALWGARVCRGRAEHENLSNLSATCATAQIQRFSQNRVCVSCRHDVAIVSLRREEMSNGVNDLPTKCPSTCWDVADAC